MEKAKWDYTKENAKKAYELWSGTKRGILNIGGDLTRANEEANIKIFKLTGSRMKAWFDKLESKGETGL